MEYNLFMVLLGCKPRGRLTEQHDIFFGIARQLSDLKIDMIHAWPEAEGKLHVDAWRKITSVDGFAVSVGKRSEGVEQSLRLYFVNLGGYRGNDFEEYHYKQLVVADSLESAVKKAKSSAFFKNHISPHVDDKYGLDVDDVFTVEDALPLSMRNAYQLFIHESSSSMTDSVEIGYLKFSDLTG